MSKLLFLLNFIFINIFFTACVSDSSSREGSEDKESRSRTVDIKGTVVDGLIKNAFICLDTNFNNVCNIDELNTTTSQDGNFTFSIEAFESGEFKIISSGGIDTATGEDFNGTLTKIINVEVNKDIEFSYITPITTIMSNIYDEEKLKDVNYTISNALEATAVNLGLTQAQVKASPLEDVKLFAKSQQLLQASRILSLDIKENTFDKVFKQLSLTINDDDNNTDFDVSKLVSDLETLNPDISIEEDITKFTQSYSDDVFNKINEINATSQLVNIQKVYESYIHQTNQILNNDSVYVTAVLDDILTDLENKTISQMLLNDESIYVENTSTLKASISSDSLANDSTPTIQGQAEAKATIIIKDDLNNTLATTQADEFGFYETILINLVDAIYNFIAMSIDSFGNENMSDAVEHSIDTISTINLDSDSDSGILDTDNITNVTTPKILTDIATAINVIDSNLSIVETTTTVANGNNFEVDLLSLKDGIYQIQNENNTTSLSIQIDTSVPIFDINETNVSITLNNLDIPKATATDNSTIVYTLSGTNAASFIIDESTGEITLEDTSVVNSILVFNVSATDLAGNVSSNFYNVILKKVDLINTDKFGSNVLANEWFGSSVAISEEYIIVSSSGNDDNTTTITTLAGSVHLYKRGIDNRVNELSEIIPSDSVLGDEFGVSLDIWKNYIVIGAPKNTSNAEDAGAVYLFKINDDDSVTQVSKIVSSDTNAFDLFGSSVSIKNNLIVVGAKYKEKDGINKVGAAYLFEIQEDDQVIELSKLSALDIELNDYFGCSVDIDGDYIIVGANGEDEGGSDAGAVYLFKKDLNNTIELNKITASDASENEMFGSSISLDEDTIVVGSQADKAYVFNKDDNNLITEVTTLTADTTSIKYAKSVSIDGNFIAIGAYKENQYTGAVYLYEKSSENTISLVSKLLSSDYKENEWFGTSVYIDNDYIVVGATKGGFKSGSAYLFSLLADKAYIPTLNNNINLYESNLFNQYRLNPTFSGSSHNYTISGDDSSLFVIQSDILKSVDSLDFENPLDSNLDNVYSITIQIKDEDNRINLYDTNISIRDLSYVNKAKLISSDASSLDKFGSSVAVDGDYILVGANKSDEKEDDAGGAYLYKKELDGSVSELFKFFASDIKASDEFGSYVDIQGDYIVVGNNIGNSYIFKKQGDTGVEELEKLNGNIVSIDGDYILCGENNGIDLAAIYLYKRNTDSDIVELTKITTPSTLITDNFANTLDIDGDYIVVGADGDNSNSGAAYVYKRTSDTNVSLLTKLTSADLEVGDKFGSSVSIDGKSIIVGAKNEGSDDTGAAYYFYIATDSLFTQQSKLIASDGEINDNFGSSVSIEGNNIVVGAIGKNEFGNDAGAAYLFKIESLKSLEESKLIGVDTQDYYFFGSSVDISGDNIVVSAHQYKEDSDKSGLVYLFNQDN